jgi:hypothetical protein
MPWPPRTPDITPLDFSFWGYVKSTVFQTPVNGLDDIKTRIQNAISAIPADMLHKTLQKLEYRLDIICAIKGLAVICCKPHVGSSICLRAKICQNPKLTLWTHCTINIT